MRNTIEDIFCLRECNEMNRIQQHILDIFKEFKSVCEKYNLRYFAIGGTCIGAVRHQGFIPWDDDLDVAMPYEDYEQFRKIAKTELKSKYKIQDYNEIKSYTKLHLKLYDSNTTLIEKEAIGHTDRYAGIFMDIMPIYGFCSSEETSYKVLKYRAMLLMNIRIRNQLRDENGIIKEAVWILLCPLRTIKPFNYYSKKIEKNLSKYKFGQYNTVIFGWRNYNGRILFPYSYFGDYSLVKFEDTEIRIPINYDKYLKQEFGDYLSIPPKEKRVSVHNIEILDYEKPYTSYI